MNWLLKLSVVRYFFVGGVAAAFDLLFFALFAHFLGFNYLLIGAIGFIAATLINYRLSVKLVFTRGARFTPRKELSAVYIVSSIGLLFHQLLLIVTIESLGFHLILGKITATGLVFFWNYLSRRLYVFSERKQS